MKRKGLLFVTLLLLLCVLSMCFVACNEPPHVHDYKMQTSDTMHWLECDCGDTKDYNSHSGGNATCVEKAECSICGEIYGEFGVHRYSYGVCSLCDDVEKSSTAGLIFELINNDLEYEVRRYNGSSTEVYIASIYNGKPVTSIGKLAFYDCSSLESIVISNSVTTIGEMAFYNCTSLRSITINDGLINIGGFAFSNCDSLTNIKIPNSVKSIDGYAFTGCKSLKWITIGDGLSSIGYDVFHECTALRSIKVDTNNENYKDINGKLYSKDGKILLRYARDVDETSFTIPNNVTSIGFKAFAYCHSLTSIVIPDSVTSIGGSAFEDCTALTSVAIGNKVTTIGYYAFEGCTSLKTIEVPNSVTSIGEHAFWGCKSLTSIIIGNSVTSIGDYAFYGCETLTSITIPDSVTNIGEGAFRYCRSLTSLTFSDTSTWYKTTNKTDWQNKTGGTEIDVTNVSTNAVSFENSGRYCFYKI